MVFQCVSQQKLRPADYLNLFWVFFVDFQNLHYEGLKSERALRLENIGCKLERTEKVRLIFVDSIFLLLK